MMKEETKTEYRVESKGETRAGTKEWLLVTGWVDDKNYAQELKTTLDGKIYQLSYRYGVWQ